MSVFSVFFDCLEPGEILSLSGGFLINAWLLIQWFQSSLFAGEGLQCSIMVSHLPVFA